mmetsp:Transcript_32623/g.79129  ORF Transcript_32623/g.79129 Transcript_32623/m.79129 type:complete len:115 (+) Transcript_32623:92-436(+)
MVDQGLPIDAQCPSSAALLGYGGVAAAVCLSNWGSAMGTWKAGQSVIYTGIRHPSSVMKNVIPIVMAGGKLWKWLPCSSDVSPCGILPCMSISDWNLWSYCRRHYRSINYQTIK